MELQQLRTFLMVAREGTLARAAKRLALSQPALSAQLKALEEELRVRLFRREPRGMTLTLDGTNLLAAAEQTVAAADALVDSARRLRAEPEGQVHLGSLPDPSTLCLGELLTRIGERHPRVQVTIQHASSREVRRGILDGEYDAGFVLGPAEPALERIDLRPTRLVIAVPSSVSPAVHTWDEVCALPWIASPEGCPFQVLAEELFARMKRRPPSGHVADFESAIVEMIDAGLGASLLREEVARQACDDGKCALVPDVFIDTTLAFVWPKGPSPSSAVAAVRDVVADFWQ